MSIVKRTSNTSNRVIGIGLLLALVSTIALASNWESVRAFAAGLGAVPQSETVSAKGSAILATGFVNGEEMLTPGTCDTAGPIEVEGTILGTTPTAYATLKAAFDAINLGTHTGAVTIDVCGDTTEAAVAAAPSMILNPSGSGAASYTSLTISPAGGAARTISGAATAGFPLIDFPGPDNVTINGLNTGSNALTISNTTVSATSNTSTIRFTTDATSNTITNSTILGSSTAALGTLTGNIIFGSAAVSTGNDNNTVSNCNLGPAGANLPTKLITFTGSSNTDPGTANSGIVLNNNNFFDWFSATAANTAIDVNSGTVNLTISNNRFYQTASRTITTTTSVVHSGVRISNSSGFGYSITGNTFGFASNTQTGNTTIVFPASTSDAVVPIILSVSTTSSPLPASIQNNTIAGFALSGAASGTGTSAPFRGVYVSGGVVNIGDVTGNTFGSQSATGSITFTSSSTSTADVIGIYNFGQSAFVVNNNTIGGITASNSSTGAANIYGFRVNTSSSVTSTMVGNTVGGSVANSIQSTSTATGSLVQGLRNDLSNATFTSNTVRNLSAAGGTGTTTSASVAGMVFASTLVNNTVGQNSIFNLSNSNTTAATVVTGIQYTASTGTNVVERNFIHGLTSATNSASAEINGIRVGGGTTTYRNNMIAIGAGITNAIGAAATNSGTTGINGINEFLGTNTFFHNSVFMGGAPTAGTGASYAFNGTQTINTRSFRDNIFFNARSNGGTATGSNYAVKINGTAPNPTGLTINNNVYFANGTGAVFGFFNSANVANVAAWRTAVGQDAGSFESNPQYNDPTNATPDLHLNSIVATVAEGNGADVGVTNDFDGQTRSGLTPVDIGADAGNFVGIDLSAPAITYTALTNTTLTTNRIQSVTITDATGVDTVGNAPRIYFNKNAGAYSSTACSLSSGTVQNGVWGCTIDNSLIGGVVVTDVIRYFVVAQDTLGNLAANPSGGFTGTNVNTVTTPPTTPTQYTIVAAISDTKTVCASGCDYATLTAAGGVFASINAGVVTGNVNIEVSSDLIVGEDGTQALNPLTEEPAGSNFTVKIYPTGSARAITSTTAPAGGFIRLNAADRVTIDGSIGGTGTDRSLTVTTANTGTTSAVVWLQSNGTDGAQNNTVKNLNVVGNSNTTTLIGIGMGATGTASVSTSSLGTNNNTNTIQNNNISKTQYGIYSQGASAGNKNTGNVITQNLMNTASPNHVARGGIHVGFENSIQITQNTIDGVTLASSPDVFGIALGLTGISTTSFTGNEVTNATVSRNFIGKVTNTGTFSAVGISVASATSGTNAITNNSIYGVGANGTGGDFGAGIFLGGGAGSTTQVYFNSVSMTGAFAGGSYPNYGLAIGGSDPTVDVRNNVFFNTVTNGTGVSFAIGTASSTFANLTSNYNDHFVTAGGGTFKTGKTGSLSQGTGTEHTLLSDWTTATGKDTPNSISANPLFNSTTNLQPQTGSPLVGAGTPVSVTTDILGVTRSVTTPTLGAYENAIDTAGPVITYTAFGNTTSTGNRTLNVTVTDTSGVPTSGVGLPVIYYRKNADPWASTQCSFVSGSSYTCDIVPAAVGGVTTGDTIQYYVAAQDNIGNVSVNPSAGAGGFTSNPPAASTPPTTPNQYTIVGTASGSYNVGSAETITSLTNTGGIFEFINNSEVTGNITINITSDLLAETGTVALNEFASPFTILIKPSGAPRTITGSINGGLIRLNGADRVRIDGSTAAMFADDLVGGNPALRELTIQNTNVGTSAVVISVGSNATNGAQNNTIQNVNVLGFDPTTTLLGISLGGATPGTTATGPNNGNRVENCSVKRSVLGIYSAGRPAPDQNTGTIIAMNEISGVTADRIRRVGIVVFNENGVQITENSIEGVSTNESADAIGIGVGNQAIDSTTTASGGVINAFVERNKINGVASVSTTGFSAAGITVAGGTGGPNTVRNNMITGVTAPATSPDIVAGIYVVGATGSSTLLYHNSVAMSGDRGSVASQMPSYGVAITGTDPTVEMKNNIFFTNQFASGGGVNAVSYAIGMVTTTFANLDSNYNDFYSISGTAFRSGSLGAAAGTSYATLALWQAAVADDANSQEVDPMFSVVAADLHLNIPSTPLLGDGIAGFATVDFDGDPRPASAPDIGADEIVQSVAGTIPAGTFYNLAGAGGDTLGGNVTVTNSLTLTGIVDAGANTLTLGCNATVSGGGTTNYVIGNFAKQYCAPGTFTYPVGTTANGSLVGEEYTPFTANVTAGTFPPAAGSPPSLTVSVTDANLPGADPLQSASRYWDVTETGDLTADISFTYLDVSPGYDVNGTETAYQVLRRSGTTAVYPGGTVNAATNTATAPGVTMFSQWAAGNLAPTAANVTAGGRVLTASGQGIYGARVMLVEPGGNVRMALTNPFGYYRFEGLPVGESYAFSVFSKSYQFVQPTIVMTIDNDRGDINFVALDGESDVNPDRTYFDNAPLDFDGDGRTDASVWRGDDNSWLIRRSSDNAFYSQPFGLGTDRLAPADFDGDGRTDLAVFRPSDGNWYIWQSRTNSLRVVQFGSSSDIPVPSDFDGDGQADMVVWRAAKNVFVVRQSTDGRTTEIAFEGAGGNPAARTGDRDGDGKADSAVFDRTSGTWLVRLSGNGKTIELAAEGKGEVPLFADFDGDARADVGSYDVGTGVWTIRQSRSGEVVRIQQGGGTDEPLIGDFDGDGRTDAGTFGGGTWLIKQSLTNSVRSLEFGLPTDKALPSAQLGQ